MRAAAFDSATSSSNSDASTSTPPLWSIPLVAASSHPNGPAAGTGATTTTATSATNTTTNSTTNSSSTGTSGSTGSTAGVVAAEVTTKPSDQFAADALVAINAARAQARVCGDVSYPAAPPLRWNVRAAFAALLEVEWMQRDNTFGHEWPTGEHVWHRLVMSGYDWSRADENIAAGFRSLDAAMEAWIDSPSHCRALMRQDVVDVGVAVIPGADTNTYLSYWAMVLAAPR